MFKYNSKNLKIKLTKTVSNINATILNIKKILNKFFNFIVRKQKQFFEWAIIIIFYFTIGMNAKLIVRNFQLLVKKWGSNR